MSASLEREGDDARATPEVDSSWARPPRPQLTRARAARLVSYYRPFRALLAADIACAVLVAVAALALPLCANRLAVGLTATGTAAAQVQSDITMLGIGMCLLLAAQAACSVFVDYRGHVMGAQMESALRRELFEHLQRLSFAFHDRNKVGQLMARLTSDLFDIAEMYHHVPEDLAIGLFKLLGALAILAYLDPQLTMAVVATLPIAFAWAWHFNGRMGEAKLRSAIEVAAINERAEDALGGVRVVQAFGNERIEAARFDASNRGFLAARRLQYRAEVFYSTGMEMFVQALTLLIIVLGAARVLDTAMNLAELMTYLLCVGILVDPIHRAVNVSRQWQSGITGFHRFMDLVELTPEVRDATGAIELPRPVGDIAFRNVTFAYQGRPQAVLRAFDLDVAAGEFVALVGSSGVGKTTLCSLIPRFHDVGAGSVTIDGVDVRRLRLASLRQHIGIVSQEPYLFAGTVAENIAYGRPAASRAEIERAAQLAGAHAFVAELPNGYDTDIGQRGVRLSGGQKQRLTIARVFLRDPPILIFDEATSALDGESERHVQAALHAVAEGRTTIVIAHRLSTIRRADRIVVLGAEGVLEQGTHTALMAARGHYYRMHDEAMRV